MKMNIKIMIAVAMTVVMSLTAISVVADSDDSDAANVNKSWLSIADKSFSMNVGDNLTITDYGDRELQVVVNTKPSWSSFSNDILTGVPTTAGTYTLTFFLQDTLEGMTGNYSTTITVNQPATNYGFTLRYDANQGTGAPANQTATSTSTSYTFRISDTIPTRTGFLFDGWASEPNATNGYWGLQTANIQLSVTSGTSVSKMIYAVWVEDAGQTYSYNLEFNLHGGSPDIEAMSGTSTDLLYDFILPDTNPQLTDYIFRGWSLTDYIPGSGSPDYQPGDTYRMSIVPSAGNSTTMTMTAVWQSVHCTITFDVNGGSGTVSPIQTTVGADFTLPGAEGISNGDLQLIGWSPTSDGDESYRSGQSITATGNAKYFAIWGNGTSPIASFIYEVNGLEATFTDTSIVPNVWQWSFGDTTVSTSQNPSHIYSEAGTYTVTLTISNSTGLSSSLSAAVTVGGSMDQTYAVAFDSNGGNVIEPIVSQGKGRIFLPEPTRAGMTFSGWFLNGVFAGNAGSIYEVNGDVTLIAGWITGTVPVWTVTFSVDGNTIATQHVVNGGTATYFTVEDDRRYFDLWLKVDLDVIGEVPYRFTDEVTEDIELYAKFTDKSWFDSGSNLMFLVIAAIVIIVVVAAAAVVIKWRK